MSQSKQIRKKTGMPASAPLPSTVCQIAVDLRALESIPQVLQMYVSPDRGGTVSVLVVVPEKDFGVERAIYDKQPQIIDASPGVRLSLRVISLRGRRLSDVIAPLNKPVFQRN